MRMHHDRPLPSPGPTKIIEFIKRLSETSLVKLSRLLAKEHIAIEGLSNIANRTHEKRENAANERISDSTSASQ